MKLITTTIAGLVATSALAVPALATSGHKKDAPSCLPVAGAECGTIRVPLIRAHPESGSTDVAYAVIRHRGAGPTKGTVAVNPGGPGGSVLASAPQYATTFKDLLTDHDLLLVERAASAGQARSSAGSPFRCPRPGTASSAWPPPAGRTSAPARGPTPRPRPPTTSTPSARSSASTASTCSASPTAPT
ncbi:hypothetical protein FHU30_006676 [Actinomadura rupiterrae]|nr:hypothetical protein [Actinomadura rupiterrae]